MTEFFATGRALELVLALMLIEGIVLIIWQRRSSVQMDLAGLLLNLISGMFLVGAVHSALVGRWWGLIALCLLGSLIMHCADLWRRWREYAHAQKIAKPLGTQTVLTRTREA